MILIQQYQLYSNGETFCSVAPPLNYYDQPEQRGRLGDNLLSGYPYYKAY